jgi:guanylate kinase
MPLAPGKLVIISGPSGVGKSSVVRALLTQCDLPLRLSVSATTRAPRAEEVEGRDYYFLSREEFAARRQRGEFLECKEVFGRGDWYGTLKSDVEAGFADGKWMMLEIDVEGAVSILAEHSAITIFIDPGSREELERRLRHRGTEDESAIRRRLEVADRELAQVDKYQYRVVNETIPDTVKAICDILKRHGD